MEKEELVYSFLEDEESKFIYKKRLEYNSCKDYHFIQQIVENCLPQFKGKAFHLGREEELIKELETKQKIVVFGSGIRGKRLLALLAKNAISVSCVVDNNPNLWGEMIESIEILPPNDIDYKEVDCVIVTPGNRKIMHTIYEQLRQLGVRKENIYDFANFSPTNLLEEQYFDEEIIKWKEREVFVDAGVYDLGTSLQFIKNVERKGTKEYKVFAFEPDKKVYKNCERYLRENPHLKIQLYNVGLWDGEDTIGFRYGEKGDSKIIADGVENTIEVVALDGFVSEEVTFIKMDIEGAELEALRGAKEMIKKYHPKLAISIYHKPEDLVEIPLYIKELVPEYKLYIRHYSNYQCETILYAVVEE